MAVIALKGTVSRLTRLCPCSLSLHRYNVVVVVDNADTVSTVRVVVRELRVSVVIDYVDTCQCSRLPRGHRVSVVKDYDDTP